MIAAIIAAGGRGLRVSSPIPKQFLEIRGKPILAWALEPFFQVNQISKVCLVYPQGALDLIREKVLGKLAIQKDLTLVEGGRTRQESVYNGLRALDKTFEWVVIHDGERPFVRPRVVEDLIVMVQEYGAVTLGTKVKETIKEVGPGLKVSRTLNRENLYRIQTPQAFRYDEILSAHVRAANIGLWDAPDDAYLLEMMGKEVRIMEGPEWNLKITTPLDIALAEHLIGSYEQAYKNRH